MSYKSVMARSRHYLANFTGSYHLKFRLANFACGLFPDFFSGVVRARVYRLAGFKLGYGCYIMGNLKLPSSQRQMYRNLEVGPHVLISTDVTINLDEKVTIEENVTLSPFVRIYTSTHKIGPAWKRCRSEPVNRPVVVERGSWVGLGATILPGVRIGCGSVVAAGAVVTRDIPPNSFAAGVPAQVVKTLPED